jgi:thymidylate synthase
MEMEQMTCLLAKMKAEIRTKQAKADVNLTEMKGEMTARLDVMIQNNQERMMATLDAHHKRMIARLDSQLKKMEAVEDVLEERLNKWDTRILRPIVKSQRP